MSTSTEQSCCDTAECNERLRIALEQATREIELMKEQEECLERRGRYLRSNASFGIMVGTDEYAKAYQAVDPERRSLEEARCAKLRVLSAAPVQP